MNVYFVRHGESEGNVANLHQNALTQLSPHGIEQAKATAQRFQKISLDLVISSNFARAHHTAQIIAEQKKVPLLLDERLQELKRPTEIEGKNRGDKEVLRIKRLINKHAPDPFWHYSDEENFYDLIHRCQVFIKSLANRKEQNILVVSHGVLIKAMVATMMFGNKITPELFDSLVQFMRTENTGITLCEHQEKHWRLQTWNDYAHLG